MFGRLAHLTYRQRRTVLGVWLLLLVVAATLAAQVGSVLGPGAFVAAGSDSAKAAALLERSFHQNNQQVTMVVIHDPRGGIHDAAFRDAVAATAARIRADAGLRVAYLDNPLVSGNRQLISMDGHSVALLVSSSLKKTQIEDQIAHLRRVVRAPGLETYVTGTPAANYDSQQVSQDDLARGDALTLPILVAILLLVFGTLVGVSLPLILAGSSIILSLALVFIAGHFIDASVYVENMVTVLGLGIGIDYSLFILYRFREELAVPGNTVEAAVVRTMETTGRAVFFSGLTVAVGISSLFLTGVPFMVSMGLGGLLVPLTSLLATMTLLPALLGLLGTRVNRLPVVPRRFLRSGERGLWHSLAAAIIRRPILAGGLALAILLALAYPATQLSFAYGSLKNQPKAEQAVAGALFMEAHFPSTSNPTQVLIQHQGAGTLLRPGQLATLRSLEAAIARDPEVARVAGPADLLPAGGAPSAAQLRQVTNRYLSADGKVALISVVARHDVGTTSAEHLVRRLRTLAAASSAGAASGNAIHVGGAQAEYTDFNDSLYARFGLIVAIVLALSYAFLFVAFRSVVLPLKAVAVNVLSVGAAYGLLQLVFQRGVGSRLLDFTPESGVAGWVPIFLFALLFGLSMDYEVFLLSRIRERWLTDGDTGKSVVFGLGRTGRLISSAAAIMVVAFSGFVLGSMVQLKELGFGLLAAVALDATLIRILLVPSVMRLLDTWNWWVPAPLRAWSTRASAVAEGDALDDSALAEGSAARGCSHTARDAQVAVLLPAPPELTGAPSKRPGDGGRGYPPWTDRGTCGNAAPQSVPHTTK
jgi:RND superfamily putative drug exporter